jgi:hypothetical protein
MPLYMAVDSFISFNKMKAKKFLLPLVLLLFFSVRLYSQDITVRMAAGLGTYSMTGMKAWNTAMMPDFDAKIVSDFPAYPYFRPGLILTWTRFSVGLEYTYQSTGSRISAKDYSGEYRLDMLVHSNNAGLLLGWELIMKNKWRIEAELKGGAAFSDLKIDYSLELNGELVEDYTSYLDVVQYFFEPGIRFEYEVAANLRLGIYGGYYLDTSDKAFKGDYNLVNPDTREGVGPEWKGLRIGISVGYTMKNSKP